MTNEQWTKVVAQATAESGAGPHDAALWDAIRLLVEPIDESALDQAIADRKTADETQEVIDLEARLAELKGR